MNQNCTHILEALLDYQKENNPSSNQSLSDFAYWILKKEKEVQKSNKELPSDSLIRNEIEEEISRLLVLMYRYAKGHLKTYLSEFQNVNQEDFTYLYALKRIGSLTKTELVELNIHDKTTGMEVIRRLVKNNLIQETVDERDKRSKILVLTEEGESMIRSMREVTKKVAKLIVGKLAEEEKMEFYQSLKKLDTFHNPLYHEKHKPALDALLDKFSLN